MSSSLDLGDLESELGSVLSEQLDLLVAVSLFGVLGPFCLRIVGRTSACDRPIERAGGHGRDGLWGTQLGV